MRGLTAHCPYLSLKGDSSRGAYYLVLDQAAYRRSHTDQGILVGEIVEAGEVQDTVVVHTYAPTGLAKSRIWKPVLNHDLSGKAVRMDKDKRLMDYRPDFDRVKFRQIITVRDTLKQPLSVRDVDEAVTNLVVNIRSLHV